MADEVDAFLDWLNDSDSDPAVVLHIETLHGITHE